MALIFAWDPDKAAANKRKHGVSFEEAATVFRDRFALFMGDPDHSEEEDRFLLLGESDRRRLLLVSHSGDGRRIRIISARRATRSERRNYAERKPKER